MERSEIFGIVARQIQAVLPDLPDSEIREDRSMTELGANSMDRVDVLVGSMEEAGLALPMTSFLGVTSIGGLVDLLWSRHQAAHG
ncbi:phosphopantetheine-binding protein [Falsiroseomonas tokyonensis]|uniref:Phosphopantetheine-binding protein n=1 Tax=Falsiroseomonas tokyonensis TaxID=430521 RepID=A0ABV7BQ31_9PROT|nr:phosphopantetheine-binding protein [Falsiroseomonas tokyonensis]MBU8536759.1 hypothetical protein [Falsiroseomonas tokyonensis]